MVWVSWWAMYAKTFLLLPEGTESSEQGIQLPVIPSWSDLALHVTQASFAHMQLGHREIP